MSYLEPVQSGQRSRPNTVVVAAYLLLAVAAFFVISSLLPLPSLGKVVDATRVAYAHSTDPTPDTMATLARVQAIASLVVALLLAVGLVVLSRLILRGSNVGRIITWVLSGLGVLCFGCGLSATGLSSQINTKSNGVDVKEATRQIDAARPGWLAPISVTLSVLGLLALIGVIILLLVPPSNDYFRRPKLAAGPGYPNVPYPAYPAAATPTEPAYPAQNLSGYQQPTADPQTAPTPPSDQAPPAANDQAPPAANQPPTDGTQA